MSSTKEKLEWSSGLMKAIVMEWFKQLLKNGFPAMDSQKCGPMSFIFDLTITT